MPNRPTLGVSPRRRRWAGESGVENGPGVGGLAGYIAGHWILYAASIVFQTNTSGIDISVSY